MSDFELIKTLPERYTERFQESFPYWAAGMAGLTDAEQDALMEEALRTGKPVTEEDIVGDDAAPEGALT